jgi:hypothetical protein
MSQELVEVIPCLATPVLRFVEHSDKTFGGRDGVSAGSMPRMILHAVVVGDVIE